jgi:hypothetical protein
MAGEVRAFFRNAGPVPLLSEILHPAGETASETVRLHPSRRHRLEQHVSHIDAARSFRCARSAWLGVQSGDRGVG